MLGLWLSATSSITLCHGLSSRRWLTLQVCQSSTTTPISTLDRDITTKVTVLSPTSNKDHFTTQRSLAKHRSPYSKACDPTTSEAFKIKGVADFLDCF
jgi:hypothetical protein